MNRREEIRFHVVSPEWEGALTEFFATLAGLGVDSTFHPHPFDASEAHRRASYRGRDEYHIAAHRQSIVAYGMLRGWDEGYEIPSLGIAVDAAWQGRGIGRRMMEHLHQVARKRGARAIRLRVHPENEAAIRLYKRLGYDFAGDERGQRIGVLSL